MVSEAAWRGDRGSFVMQQLDRPACLCDHYLVASMWLEVSMHDGDFKTRLI